MELKRILIVEKDKSVVEQIRKALNRENFDIIEASNGWDGWVLAIEKIPDLIISNIDLPRLSGVQFLKEMKKCPIINKIPFIIITTYTGNSNLSSFIFSDSKTFKLHELSNGAFCDFIKEKLKLKGIILSRLELKLLVKRDENLPIWIKLFY
jgi:CheY-like chemotaxis protein